MSTQQERFTAIADAIRAKKGTTAAIVANDFASEIENLPSESAPETVTVSILGLTTGVSVTIYYPDNTETQDFEGEDLVFAIPVNEYYKINFSNMSGYITPAPLGVYKAVAGYERAIIVEYIESEAATIYFDKTIASTQNISGEVNQGAIASIFSQSYRCLSKPHPTIGGQVITMLAGETDQYTDGEPAATDGSEGDVMVYLPNTFYLNEKIDDDSSRLSISESTIGAGQMYAERLIAAYKTHIGEDGIPRSISGVLPTSSVSPNGFRSASILKGDGWSNIHYDDHCLIAMLFYAKYGNRDSQAVTGTGALNYGSGLTGTTNSLLNTDTNGYESGKANNFMGIEAYTGWYYEWVDGVEINNGVWTITQLDGTTRNVQGITTSGWITRLAFEEGGYFDIIPIEVGGSSSSYYADYFMGSTSTVRVLARSGYSTVTYGGVACTYTSYDSTNTYAYCGSRLAFHGTITIVDPATYRSL
ncbi:MAG: hypothetical protein SNG81_10025 [Rikenellaceae bacterium]